MFGMFEELTKMRKEAICEPTCAISPLTAGGASLTTNSASINSSSTNSGFDLAKFLDSFETDKVLKNVLGGDSNLRVVF